MPVKAYGVGYLSDVRRGSFEERELEGGMWATGWSGGNEKGRVQARGGRQGTYRKAMEGALQTRGLPAATRTLGSRSPRRAGLRPAFSGTVAGRFPGPTATHLAGSGLQ